MSGIDEMESTGFSNFCSTTKGPGGSTIIPCLLYAFAFPSTASLRVLVFLVLVPEHPPCMMVESLMMP